MLVNEGFGGGRKRERNEGFGGGRGRERIGMVLTRNEIVSFQMKGLVGEKRRGGKG